MRSAEELRERIQALYDADDRLDRRNYLGRNWVATYAADAAIIADCLLELLDGRSPMPRAAAGQMQVR